MLIYRIHIVQGYVPIKDLLLEISRIGRSSIEGEGYHHAQDIGVIPMLRLGVVPYLKLRIWTCISGHMWEKDLPLCKMLR